MDHNKILESLRILQKDTHKTAKDKGWFDKDKPFPECLALMHSELSEALEAYRHHSPKDEHCPEFGNLEIELADCIIRIFDYAEYAGLDVPGAILAKNAYNKTRPYRHGNKKI